MGLEEAVGLGVTISLVDLFTEGAEKIVERFKELGHESAAAGEAVEHALHQMEGGLATAAIGTAGLVAITKLGDAAVETSEKFEKLKILYEGLAPESEGLYEKVRAITTELGGFSDEAMLGAGRALLGMNVNADKIPAILHAAAAGADGLQESLGEVAGTVGRLQMYADRGVISPLMLRRLKLTVDQLRDAGLDIDKKGKFKGGADALMDSVARAMESRFGAASRKIQEMLPAIETGIKRQIEGFYEAAGTGGLTEIKTSIAKAWLDILKALDTEKIGAAFGAGLTKFYDMLRPIGHAAWTVAEGFAKFLAQHPRFVQFAATLAGVVSVTLIAVGAFQILGAVVKTWPILWKLAEEAMVKYGVSIEMSLAPALPLILGLAGVGYVLYQAWERDFGGMTSRLKEWYSNIDTLVEGVIELFTSEEDGLGSVPEKLYDKLVEKGLWGIAKSIFLWGNRVIEFVESIMTGLRVALEIPIFLFDVFALVLEGCMWVVGKFTQWVAGASNALFQWNLFADGSIGVARLLGWVVGGLTGIFVTYYGWLIAAKGATIALTAVKWLLAEAFTAEAWLSRAAWLAMRIMTLQNWWAAASATGFATATWGAVTATAALVGTILLAALPFILVGAAILLTIAYFQEMEEAFMRFMNNPFVAWLVKPKGVSTADFMHEQEERLDKDHADRKRDLAGNGRGGFFSRLADNSGMAADTVGLGGDSSGGQGLPGMIPGDWAPSGGGAGPVFAPQPPIEIHLFLDGEKIHSAVVNQEQAKASRQGAAG